MAQSQKIAGPSSDGASVMTKRTQIGLAAAFAFLSAATFWGVRKWSGNTGSAREEALALMPTDASAVLFLDFDALRQAPFVAQLYAWVPKPKAEADYEQFVKETGFDYERDVNRLAIAVVNGGQDSVVFAIVDGKFDRQKITALAKKAGNTLRTSEHEILSVPVSGAAKRISFTFLRNDRIALTNDTNLAVFLDGKKKLDEVAEWRARFERLAGSPVFVVIRREAALGAALCAQAPGGYRSPQLCTLLDQLQWITLAGKPENDRLRVVAEGECSAEATVRQLADVMNGVIILAEGGLNDAKTRQQLNPALRESYLELLKSADVSKIDRGDSKSVRLVFDITPAFLEAARRVIPVVPDSAQSKRPVRNVPSSGKGHT